jgi:hypothetical protein
MRADMKSMISVSATLQLEAWRNILSLTPPEAKLMYTKASR